MLELIRHVLSAATSLQMKEDRFQVLDNIEEEEYKPLQKALPSREPLCQNSMSSRYKNTIPILLATCTCKSKFEAWLSSFPDEREVALCFVCRSRRKP